MLTFRNYQATNEDAVGVIKHDGGVAQLYPVVVWHHGYGSPGRSGPGCHSFYWSEGGGEHRVSANEGHEFIKGKLYPYSALPTEDDIVCFQNWHGEMISGIAYDTKAKGSVPGKCDLEFNCYYGWKGKEHHTHNFRYVKLDDPYKNVGKIDGPVFKLQTKNGIFDQKCGIYEPHPKGFTYNGNKLYVCRKSQRRLICFTGHNWMIVGQNWNLTGEQFCTSQGVGDHDGTLRGVIWDEYEMTEISRDSEEFKNRPISKILTPKRRVDPPKIKNSPCVIF